MQRMAPCTQVGDRVWIRSAISCVHSLVYVVYKLQVYAKQGKMHLTHTNVIEVYFDSVCTHFPRSIRILCI